MSELIVLVYGAGGFGREAAWLVECCSSALETFRVGGFIDDDPKKQGQILNGIPVMTLAQAAREYPGALVIGGVGVPALRQELMLRAALYFSTATFIHPSVVRSPYIEIGAGTLICAGTTLTTNIRLGAHVQINPGCTIGHDVVMGDYASLAPGVHLSGHVEIGPRALLGSGAVVINGQPGRPLVIGADAVVGAGACVTRSVALGQTVVGVPAHPLEKGE